MGGFAHQDSWRQRVCSGRRMILILMGILAVVTLSLVVLGFMGHNYSTTLRKMKEDLKTSNRTLAVELADLEQKEINNLKSLKKVNQMVENFTKEAMEVKTQYLDQIQKLQETLQKMNCDLEEIKHKGKGPASGCCPRGWHLFQQGCYWLSSAENGWAKAKEDCEEKSAHLVIITGYLEQQFVARLAKSERAWIGLEFSNQAWKWVDGTPYTVRRIDWRPDEPMHVSVYCSMMYRDGLWSQAPCRVKLKWMCEKLAQQ
ncbi:asialoglycoprotein receptor 1-like isoform X2 [Pituophis catenifer annectens]|uniref:asialoglycoprotein receptor 1-like isoform X2 n=1 Tax=Pituophis catenifer annectens TaxID=94852 RepID=UPI003991C98B